jgi:hypothetical protein
VAESADASDLSENLSARRETGDGRTAQSRGTL